MMFNRNSFIFLIIGAAIGGAVSYYLTKTKYERLIDDEIESVKEAFRRRNDSDGEPDAKVEEPKEKTRNDISKNATQPSPAVSGFRVESKSTLDKPANTGRNKRVFMDYNRITTSYEAENNITDNDEESSIDIIDETEIGIDPDYEILELDYYADGVFADSRYNTYKGLPIPKKALDTLPDYNEDEEHYASEYSLYLKDSENKKYYAIHKSVHSYIDIVDDGLASLDGDDDDEY